MSVVNLPFYQLAMSYTHLMSQVLSKKIKHDFLHGKAINFWHRSWSLFIRRIKLHLTFLSYSTLVTSIKEKMKIDFLHQENCFFLGGGAQLVTLIFSDATGHTSPSCHEHTNRPFPHSCKQRHQLEAQVDKIQRFVWNCQPKPRPHFFMFAHWRVRQKRSITPLLQNFFWLETNKMTSNNYTLHVCKPKHTVFGIWPSENCCFSYLPTLWTRHECIVLQFLWKL